MTVLLCFSFLSYIPVKAAQVQPVVKMVSQPSAEYNAGDRVIVKFNCPNYANKVQYRAFLWQVGKGYAQEIYKNYPKSGYFYKPVCVGKSVFTIDVFYPQNPGTYYIVVLAKANGAKKYSSYVYTAKFVVKQKAPSVTTVSTLDVDGKIYGSNDAKKPAIYDNDVKLAAKNITLQNTNIAKDLYINADNSTINNVNVSGTIYINPGTNGSANLNNVKAKNIKVLSGGQDSIHLVNVTASSLSVDNASKTNPVRVESDGTTTIDTTVVGSYSIIDNKSGTFGTVEVKNDDNGQLVVEFRGTFSNPIIVDDEATIKAADNASIANLQIAPTSKDDKITLDGTFKTVQITNEAKVELTDGTKVETFDANANTDLTAGLNTQITTLDKGSNEVNISGDGAGSVVSQPIIPIFIGGGSIAPVQNGDILFDDRIKVSENINNLAVGAKEHTIVSANKYGNPNTSYFCDANIITNSNIKIMSCYGGYDASKWSMMTLSQQAAAAQAYFNKTDGYKNYKVVGILNGDFFNMTTGEPVGALVMNGVKYHDAGYEPYFAILKNGTAVIRDSSVPLDDCVSAVGGNEILVKDGVIDPELKATSDPYEQIMYTRTAIGIKEDGNVITMCTHGFSVPESYGLSFYEIAAYMKAMGCENVLMLDGGGSSEWCSKYEGTNDMVVRNMPSDGCERQVSSSILIINTAVGDGIFNHATISPSATVYTPNSTVAFTATGVDSAGCAANIPEGTTWALDDNSYGTIDTNGVFTSNGKTGDVTVQLKYNNTVVGKSVITIAVPDSISFSSSEISIGRSQESNLGIMVRYKGQKINYHAGDLIWGLSDDNMGTINTETNTFTASPNLTTTGIITVTSKYDESVCGSITVKVGQDPTEAMDFEDHKEADGTVTDADTYWGADSNGKIVGRANFAASGGGITYLTPATGMITTGCYNRGGNESAQIVSRADGYPVHLGTNSLKINYDMTKATGTEGASVGLTQDYVIPGTPTAIGLWVYVPDNTPNLWLRVRLAILDANGNVTSTTQFNFTDECKIAFADRGTYGGLSDVEPGTWKFLSADLSAYAGSRFKMLAGETIRIMWTSSTTTLPANLYNSRTDVTDSHGIYLSDGRTISQADCTGSIYVDDLMFIYGSINEDAKAPTVTSFTANNGAMSDGTTFNTDTISFKSMFTDDYDEVNKVAASGIDFNNVYMYVDGQLMKNAVIDKGGMIELDGVKLANGEHSVKLLVCDLNGNEKILNYSFIVNAADNTATTVQIAARQDKAVLGKSVDLDINTNELSNINAVTTTLQIDSRYQNSYSINPGNGYSIDQSSIKYDTVNHTVTFTANRNGDAVSNGSGTIATISFAIPTSLAEGTYFNYRAVAGSITYAGTYTETNQPSFSSMNYRLPAAAPYNISSDVIVAGMNGSYFYVKDANGNAVPNVTVYFSDGSTIGTTDENGKVAVPVNIINAVTSFTIYAMDNQGNVSFSYTEQSYAAGGASDGSPVHILNNVATNGSTDRNLSWMSNPVYSQAAAEVQISDSESNIESGKIYNGTSNIITFKGSALASENYAARINDVTITGLTPGTTYYYRVGDGSTWSAVSNFTMPMADSDTNMFVLGDIQATDTTNIQTILQTLKGDTVNYDLGIQTGDAVELGSLYSDWTKTLGLFDSLKSNQVMLHTIGNHELTGESCDKISSAIYNLKNPSYYSVRYGLVYVATISYMSSMTDYQKALEWLVNDASQSNALYKILVMHQPAYYTNVTDPSNEQLHELLPAYAEKAGINIVFAGHDHSYARTEPINGVTYYICGTSGEKSYPVTNNPDFHFITATDNFTAIYLTVNATKDALTVTTYDLVNGVPKVIDTYTK